MPTPGTAVRATTSCVGVPGGSITHGFGCAREPDGRPHQTGRCRRVHRGIPLMQRLDETRPDRRRARSAPHVAHRCAVRIADPDADRVPVGESDAPVVAQILARSGLDGGPRAGRQKAVPLRTSARARCDRTGCLRSRRPLRDRAHVGPDATGLNETDQGNLVHFEHLMRPTRSSIRSHRVTSGPWVGKHTNRTAPTAIGQRPICVGEFEQGDFGRSERCARTLPGMREAGETEPVQSPGEDGRRHHPAHTNGRTSTTPGRCARSPARRRLRS